MTTTTMMAMTMRIVRGEGEESREMKSMRRLLVRMVKAYIYLLKRLGMTGVYKKGEDGSG